TRIKEDISIDFDIILGIVAHTIDHEMVNPSNRCIRLGTLNLTGNKFIKPVNIFVVNKHTIHPTIPPINVLAKIPVRSNKYLTINMPELKPIKLTSKLNNRSQKNPCWSFSTIAPHSENKMN